MARQTYAQAKDDATPDRAAMSAARNLAVLASGQNPDGTDYTLPTASAGGSDTPTEVTGVDGEPVAVYGRSGQPVIVAPYQDSMPIKGAGTGAPPVIVIGEGMDGIIAVGGPLGLPLQVTGNGGDPVVVSGVSGAPVMVQGNTPDGSIQVSGQGGYGSPVDVQGYQGNPVAVAGPGGYPVAVAISELNPVHRDLFTFPTDNSYTDYISLSGRTVLRLEFGPGFAGQTIGLVCGFDYTSAYELRDIDDALVTFVATPNHMISLPPSLLPCLETVAFFIVDQSTTGNANSTITVVSALL